MIPKDWDENLQNIIHGHQNGEQLLPLISKLLTFTDQNDWRGACHESSGLLYVVLNELDIQCKWWIGQVEFIKKVDGHTILFDHSWITINNEIFDIAIYRTKYPQLDLPPTIRSKSLDSLGTPDILYSSDHVRDDSPATKRVKAKGLCAYFDNSPIDPQHGTWAVIQRIGKAVGLELNLEIMRAKYQGVYWQGA